MAARAKHSCIPGTSEGDHTHVSSTILVCQFQESNYTQINNNESINDREIGFPPKMLQIPPKMLALFSNANACLLFSKKCRHNLERPINDLSH